jgi:alpha-glucosidase (family GH31 glycosyl hydrolase)
LLPIKQGQWYTTKDLLFFHILHLLIRTHTLHIGDNRACFDDLTYSIVSVLNFGNYGILIIGANICGFNDETTKDTCNRWIQTGAFYLFSESNNNLENQTKELYLWKPATISRQ